MLTTSHTSTSNLKELAKPIQESQVSPKDATHPSEGVQGCSPTRTHGAMNSEGSGSVWVTPDK